MGRSIASGPPVSDGSQAKTSLGEKRGR
jgi:hypothetical protein